MKAKRGFFITGTDTGVGKTCVSAAILFHLAQKGKKVAGFKPVASGISNGVNEDAYLLKQYSNINLPYEMTNPFLLKEAVAPHIAAEKEDIHLSVSNILSYSPKETFLDYAVVEGCGGWLVPLNKEETMADLAIALNYPVIIVVGVRLGCLNHTLLTLASIQSCNLDIAGWIANILDPEMLCIEKNIQSLKECLPSPLLGIMPYQKVIDIELMASNLNIA